MKPSTIHETLTALREFIDSNGYPPTVRQLGDVLGLASPASVQRRLDGLERLKLIERPRRGVIVVKS